MQAKASFSKNLQSRVLSTTDAYSQSVSLLIGKCSFINVSPLDTNVISALISSPLFFLTT